MQSSFPVEMTSQGLVELLTLGIPTGSRVVGGFSEESDWDIVIPVTSSEEAKAIVEPYIYYESPSNYFNGCKYGILSSKGAYHLNLLFVHPREFLAWFRATRALRGEFRDGGIDLTKNGRVTIFETLMVQFRDKIPLMTVKEFTEHRSIAVKEAQSWEEYRLFQEQLFAAKPFNRTVKEELPF